jgi:hypothetical protein
MPNNFQPHIPDFQKGERLSAARLNELADAIAKILWQKQQASNAAFGVRTPLEIIGKLDDDLPAATNFGTTPGEAVMSVWFRDQNGDLIDSGRNENIKQRFTSAVDKAAGDEIRAAWIEGEWVALPSGGGGELIQFQPTDVCEGIGLTCYCMTATVLTASCGSSVQPGDTIQVWDQSRGWFQMPEELLFASVGWANKVKVTEAEQYDLPFDVGPCRYVVISMDCIEQEPV